MKFACFASIALTILATNCWAQSDEYQLPEDKSKPIITMQATGGFRMRPKVKPEPMLSIYPDGKVVAGKTWDGIGRAEWKISQKEIQALLKFCIKENKMHEHTTDGIQKAIKESGKRVMVADAPSTEISINTKDKQNTVSVYALTFAKRQFSGIKAIGNVAAVEQRLKQIHALTVVGGPEKMEKIFKAVNEAMKKKDENAPKLDTSDLGYAQKREDGTVKMSISKQIKTDDGKMKANYIANVSIKKDGKPEIAANVFRPRKR